jgi:hypothetical protein
MSFPHRGGRLRETVATEELIELVNAVPLVSVGTCVFRWSGER